MATDTSGTELRGLGVPYTLTRDHIWDAQSSFTEQSPRPGVAVAQQPGTLRLETGGSQSAGGSLDLLTHRAGTPGPGGAGFLWKNTADAATLYRGRDVQQIAGSEPIAFVDGSSSTYSAADEPDCCALPDGTVIAVFQATARASSTIRRLVVAVRSPTADTWNLTDLETRPATTNGDGYHPGVAYNPVDGRVYVFAWTYDTTANRANIRTFRGTVTGGTWVWETAARYALRGGGVDVSGTPGGGAAGYEVSRIRAGFAQGQCLILAEGIKNNTTGGGAVGRNVLLQFASADNGLSFVDVTENSGGAALTDTQYFDPDVVVIDDTFYCSIWSVVEFSSTRYLTHQWVPLASAFFPAVPRTDSTGIILGGTGSLVSFTGHNIDGVPESSNAVTTHGAAAWADEDGTVYVLLRVADSGDAANGQIVGFQSTDRGRTWAWLGGASSTTGAQVYSGGSSATTWTGLSGCSTQGRQMVLHQTVSSSTTFDPTVRATALGGYTSLTLPGTVALPETYQRDSYDLSYVPQVDPGSITGYTSTTSGTNSSTITEDGLYLSTSTGTNYRDRDFSATTADGFLFRFAYEVDSGGSLSVPEVGVILTLADGTDDYQVSIRLTTTQIRVVDVHGATTLATSGTLSGAQDVLVALRNGAVSVWRRDYDQSHDRTWTNLVDAGSVTSDTGTPGSADNFQIGNISSGTAISLWKEWHLMIAANAGDLADGFTNPDDLLSREYPLRGRAVYLTDGVRVSAIDGAAVEGDEYLIEADAEYPIERILHAHSPDSRVLWKGTSPGINTAAAAEVIAFQLNPDDPGNGALGAGGLLGDLIFITLEGINFAQFTLAYTTSSSSPSWTTLATIDGRIQCDDADLKNNIITLPSSGTNTGGDKIHLSADECVGWTGQIGTVSSGTEDGGISNGFKITANSGGFLDLHTGVRPRFQVMQAPSGAGRFTGTNALTLIPDRVTVVVNTAGQAFRGLRISITSAKAYGQAFQIGRILIGHVLPFGVHYSRGRQIELDPGTITEDSPDGVRRSLDLDRALRSLRIAWTDPVDQSQLWNDGTAPDYLTGSTTAGNAPLTAEADVPVALQNLFARLGAGVPVVYLPRIPRSTGAGTDVVTLNRREQHLTVYLDGTIQIESVLGREVYGSSDLEGEAFRIATIPFVEAI